MSDVFPGEPPVPPYPTTPPPDPFVWPEEGPAPHSTSFEIGLTIDVYLRDNSVLENAVVMGVFATPTDYLISLRIEGEEYWIHQSQVAYALQVQSLSHNPLPEEERIPGYFCVHCVEMGCRRTGPFNKCRRCNNRYCRQHRYIHTHRPPSEMPI
jgi:hypothetical protein